MEYKNKDIVFVNNYKYKNGSSGKNHNFVIVDDNKAIDINYFGFLLSSKTNKTGQKFPYNILLPKNETNNLKYDSIVKCDDLITIDKNEIEFKIGEVSDEDLKEFKSLILSILVDIFYLTIFPYITLKSYCLSLLVIES